QRADLVVPLQRVANLLDFDLIDTVHRFRTPLRPFAEHELYVDLQYFGDLVQHGELVEAARTTLDFVDPALRFADPVGEHLLGHLPPLPPVRYAASGG